MQGGSGLGTARGDCFGFLDLSDEADDAAEATAEEAVAAITRARQWAPGMDVVHAQHGPGWVWGSGVGRVTVRFETAHTAPGPVRTFRVDDPDLVPRPVGLVDGAQEGG